MKKMKKFMRSLSINERKGLIYSLVYSCFCFLHILIIKILIQVFDLRYLTILTETGSIITLMSFYRMWRCLNKFTQSTVKDTQIIFSGGILSFITYAGYMASLNWVSSTNAILIIRLFPFLLLISDFISGEKKIPTHAFRSLICYIITLLIILLPLLDSDQSPGIFLCLTSVFFKFASSKYWNIAHGITIDLFLLSVGFFSASIGGMSLIVLYKKMEKIGGLGWIFIILNALTSYILKIFLIKLLKNNYNNEKLLIFNLIILFLAIPCDYFFFGVKFNYYYLILFALFIDSIFFVKRIIKRSQTEKIGDKINLKHLIGN